eukprot:9737286-Alexandrium_andersonii.AAC.1
MQIKFLLKDLLAAQKRAERAQVFTEKRLEAAFLPPPDFLRHWEKDRGQREQLQPEPELASSKQEIAGS